MALLMLCMCCPSMLVALVVAYIIYKKKSKKSTATSTTSSSSSSNTTSNTEGTAVTGGESGKTNITFYGQTAGDDNGIGLSGIDLDAHGKANLTLGGRPVYAGAVHQYAGSKFMYKVLEVQGGGVKPLLIHVVDICDAKDSVCNKNIKGAGFLVDIFRTGFAAAGKSDGILQGTYKVVGEIPYDKIPKSAWKESYIMPSCTGKCSEKERKWVKRPGS